MTEKKDCKTCKKQKLNLQDWLMVIVGFYMLSTSIYGTIHLIRHFMN